MSYTIDLIIVRLPSSDADAWQEIERIRSAYHDSTQAPAPILIELHARLIDRHPCLSSYAPDDPERSECVWADGPLIGNFGQEMGRLAISTAWIDSVVPFVIEQAHAMGITVVDWFNEQMWRPSDLAIAMHGARVRFAAQSAAIDFANYPPFVVTGSQLQASGIKESSAFYKWFVDKFPDGELLDKVCFFLREQGGVGGFNDLWFFNKMLTLVDAPERVARMLQFVDATESGIERRLESAKYVTENDADPAISTEPGESVATRGCFSPALTVRPESHATTTGEDAHAVSLENEAHAVSKDSNSYAVTFGNSSFAIARGDRATAVALGGSSSAVTTGNGAEAFTTSAFSNAMSIRDESNAVTLSFEANASTLGANSIAVTLGKKSFAASMGEGGVAISVGQAGRVRAAKGGALVLALRDAKGRLLGIRAAMVGQDCIEADTWYQLDASGEFEKIPELP